jgi:hypothetical protein
LDREDQRRRLIRRGLASNSGPRWTGRDGVWSCPSSGTCIGLQQRASVTPPMVVRHLDGTIAVARGKLKPGQVELLRSRNLPGRHAPRRRRGRPGTTRPLQWASRAGTDPSAAAPLSSAVSRRPDRRARTRGFRSPKPPCGRRIYLACALQQTNNLVLMRDKVAAVLRTQLDIATTHYCCGLRALETARAPARGDALYGFRLEDE